VNHLLAKASAFEIIHFVKTAVLAADRVQMAARTAIMITAKQILASSMTAVERIQSVLLSMRSQHVSVERSLAF